MLVPHLLISFDLRFSLCRKLGAFFYVFLFFSGKECGLKRGGNILWDLPGIHLQLLKAEIKFSSGLVIS